MKSGYGAVNLVRNVYAVLSQKEQDVARVRREIQALLIAIPLLENEQPTWEELKPSWANGLRADPPSEEALRELEAYYPFIKNLRLGNGSGA